jgi:Bacterial PH domain
VDNFPSVRTEARFVPDRRYTALAAGGVVVALAVLLTTDDSPGRLILGIAAMVLAGYAATDLFFSPRLVASAQGVAVNAPLTRARLAWADIEDIRADTRLRFGLRSTTLEIDAGSTLAVLSRRSIGADPAEAAELIRAFRPAS